MKPKRRQIVAALLLLVNSLALLFLNAPVRAQSLNFTINRKKVNVDFKMIKNLIIIPLTLNDKGPFNFIMDTGVGSMIITDPTLVDSLDIVLFKTLKISGFGEGEDINAGIAPAINIKISSDISGIVPAAILSEDAFNLSNYVGMPIHGLIGYDVLSSFIVKINYQSNVLTVFKYNTNYIPPKSTKIPITLEGKKPYMTAEMTLADNTKVSAKLIIDTGAGHPVSLEANAGVPFAIPENNIPGNLGVGLNGPISGYISRIPSIKFGGLELNNIISAYPDYEDVGIKVTTANRTGNIGNSVLKRFTVTFDYYKKTMYINAIKSKLREPFEYDMSGIELTSAGDDFSHIIISRIEKGSAAEEAGLKQGDEILSINFKPAREIGMEEINNLFRSKNDRSMVLNILPKTTTNKELVVLTLKRRI